MQISAYAQVDLTQAKVISLILVKGNDQTINSDLDVIVKHLQSLKLSQYSKIQQYSSPSGTWFYRPLQKQLIQLLLGHYQTNIQQADMILDTIQNKILSEGSSLITLQQRQNIEKLLTQKDTSSLQKIIGTLELTQQTVQQNIEKMVINKQELQSLEVKTDDMSASSKVFLNSSSEISSRLRRRRLMQQLLVGAIVLSALGMISYIIFG